MEQDTNDRADETRTDTSDTSAEVLDEQLIEEISIDGMCGVY